MKTGFERMNTIEVTIVVKSSYCHRKIDKNIIFMYLKCFVGSNNFSVNFYNLGVVVFLNNLFIIKILS